MNIRTLFSVFAVLIGIGGIVAIAAPAFMLAAYGVQDADPVSMALLRYVGATGVGLAVMAWFARNAEASSTRDALVLGLTVMTGLAAIVLFVTMLSGPFNMFGWLPVAMYAIFALLFTLVGRRSMARG